jgi:hypothetical protein
MRILATFILAASLASCASKSDSTAPTPCTPDTFEPNESATERASLGAIQDDDAPGQTSPAPKRIQKELSLHGETDADWFDVEVRDTGFGGNPGLRVIVSEGLEATAWWDCTNGTTESVICGLGEAVTNDPALAGRGCKTQGSNNDAPPQITMRIECAGTSTDNGTLHVRVVRAGAASTCVNYRLTVEAE